MISFRGHTASSLLLLVASALALSSCSLGMFGSGEDEAVKKARDYRELNLSCSGLQTGQDTIDVPMMRAMLKCFNSYGALDPIEKLTLRLSDRELEPLVKLGNEYFLKNKTRLHEMETSFLTLKENKVVDQTLFQAGRLLENSEFVAVALSMAREGYVGPDRELFLRALERLSQKFTPPMAADLTDAVLTLASSKAWRALLPRFAGDSPSGRKLQDLTDGLHAYYSSKDPNQFEAGKEAIQAIINGNGRLLRALDEVGGVTEDQLRENVPRLTSVLKLPMRKGVTVDGNQTDAAILDDLTSVHHYLNRPLFCLGGSKVIPNGGMFMIRELSNQNTSEAADYIRRKNPLIVSAMNPFCDYPPELGRYYPALERLADSNAIEPAIDLLKAFSRNDLAEFLVKMMSDTGSALPGLPPENTARLKYMLPILSELTERGVWEDAYLTAALLREQDRARIASELQFWMEPALDGQSMYDVITRVLSNASVSDIYKLVSSLKPFVTAKDPIAEPALKGLRSAFYVNDTHPVISLAHDFLADARRNSGFYDTFFKTTTFPEFEQSIALISDMAKDGRARDLIGAIFSFMHRVAEEGAHPIALTQEPRFEPKSRHNLSSADLKIPEIVLPPIDENDPCRKLDPRIKMDQYNDPLFEKQLNNYLGCINRKGDFDDVVKAVNFLRNERASDGRTFFNVQIDLMKSFQASKEEMSLLVDKWIASVDDLRFYRLMDAFPLLVSKNYPGTPGEPMGPVLRPLLELARPLTQVDSLPSLRRLGDFASSMLTRVDLPGILKYAEDLWDRPGTDPVDPPQESGFDLGRIMQEVRNRECVMNPNDQLARARQIVADYTDSINSWELTGPSSNRQPRREWKLPEFKDRLEPILAKFSDPSQSNAQKPALDGLLNTLRYFSLQPGQQPNSVQHYTPEELADFLYNRSRDYRAVVWFYPDERKPRVRLVNSLDRLELVMLAADMEYPVLPGPLATGNYSLKFLRIIGEAWSDEPVSAWPAEIRARWPKCPARVEDRAEGDSRCPITLREAYQEMVDTKNKMSKLAGYPDVPSCSQVPVPDDQYRTVVGKSGGITLPDWLAPHFVKASLFNIPQVLSIIEENLPARGPNIPGTPGYRPNAGGMRVIRDLLWEVYSTSPADVMKNDGKDSHKKGDRNNLMIANGLVRLGLMHQASRMVRAFPSARDPELLDFLHSFIEASNSADLSGILQRLMADRKHALMWNIFENLFSALSDPAETRNLKQTAFNVVAGAGGTGLIHPALAQVGSIIGKSYDYLSRNADVAVNLLKSRDAARVARSWYEDQDEERKRMLNAFLLETLNEPTRGPDLFTLLRSVDDDAVARQSWKEFRSRLDALRADEAFKKLNLGALADDMLHFFEESPPAGQPQPALRVREYIARILLSKNSGASPSDVEEVVTLVARKPEDFYQFLQTLSHYTENGDLKEFVRLARRSLAEPPH